MQTHDTPRPAKTPIGRLLAEQRERMRRAVTETLEAEPGQRYAWLSEHDADGDVVLAVAIRDVGTAELWISRERYEAFDLMQVLRAAEAPAA